jgi:CBS-domain-containing membrane protein
MSIGRICVRHVDVAKPEESVQAGAQRMQARKVGSLVVINRAYEPIGIVTDRDLTVRVLAAGRDASDTMLADVMTKDPTTVTSETPVEDALRLMRNGSFRRLPVVDEAGKLSGLLSLDDILDLLSHEFREIGKLLAEENPKSVAQEYMAASGKSRPHVK